VAAKVVIEQNLDQDIGEVWLVNNNNEAERLARRYWEGKFSIDEEDIEDFLAGEPLGDDEGLCVLWLKELSDINFVGQKN
jgi:hypothetical protein